MQTSTPMSPKELDRLARKRAGAKLGWYLHAALFLSVNLLIFAISEYGWGHRSWSVKPMLGWGLGLVLHGASVWLAGAGSDLRERMVQKERDHLQRQQGSGNPP